MSFKCGGVLVTLNNYISIFGDYEPDILDEIRSAILDDTPISPFIARCCHDSYKLGQIRMALREYVPEEYLNVNLSGECIHKIRMAYKAKIDLKPLLEPKKYLYCLESESISHIIDVLIHGIDISKIDFSVVPIENVEVICEGLIQGYPMWLCVSNDKELTPSYIRQLMKGMLLQIDIHPFISEVWTDEQLIFLFTNAKVIDINDLLMYVNHNFTVEHLSEICEAYKLNLDFKVLCLQDEDNFPAFNPYQLEVLRKTLEDGVFCEDIYNPSINDRDMRILYNQLLEKKKLEHKPVLRGHLSKGDS